MQTVGLFVRGGELSIGNTTHPHKDEAKIILHGNESDGSFVFDDSIRIGTKFIVNINKVSMVGTTRKKYLTRLHKAAHKGSKEIFVEPSLDFVKGDRLGIAPTSFDEFAKD